MKWIGSRPCLWRFGNKELRRRSKMSSIDWTRRLKKPFIRRCSVSRLRTSPITVCGSTRSRPSRRSWHYNACPRPSSAAESLLKEAIQQNVEKRAGGDIVSEFVSKASGSLWYVGWGGCGNLCLSGGEKSTCYPGLWCRWFSRCCMCGDKKGEKNIKENNKINPIRKKPS